MIVIHKTKKSFSIIFLFVLFFTSSCVMTRGEIAEEAEGQQVTNIQRNLADQTGRFRELEAEIRALNGKTETLELKVSQLNQSNESLKKTKSEGDSALVERVNVLKDELIKQRELISALSQKIDNQASKANSASTKASGSSSPSQILWSEAESFYEQKEWKKSILSYQKFRDTYPSSPKASVAILKSGQGFLELGLKDEARAFFEEVIEKFPESASAKTAKARLAKLK